MARPKVGTLDLRGLRCPLPVIRLEARMRAMALGEEVEVLADDPLAKLDLPHAARMAGFACEALPAGAATTSFRFLVRAPSRNDAEGVGERVKNC